MLSYRQLRRDHRSYQRIAGFTVLELIIVVVIIAVLSAVSLIVYNGAQRNAMDAQVKQTVSDARKSF